MGGPLQPPAGKPAGRRDTQAGLGTNIGGQPAPDFGQQSQLQTKTGSQQASSMPAPAAPAAPAKAQGAQQDGTRAFIPDGMQGVSSTAAVGLGEVGGGLSAAVIRAASTQVAAQAAQADAMGANGPGLASKVDRLYGKKGGPKRPEGGSGKLKTFA